MSVTPVPSADLEQLEIDQLLEAVYRHYGYDFRDYAYSSLRRRIRERVRAEGTRTISGLKDRVLHDSEVMDRLAIGLSVNVSAMFRDPSFYRAFRREVVPILKTYPFFRIWHAGCSTGEEVYSMAILLAEEGLYERCRIYATDINEAVLRTAREGVFPLARMKQNTANYVAAESRAAFSEYYAANADRAEFHAWLRKNVVFAQHNLVTDGPFNEFQVVVCRNVMIYFNKRLQARVHGLFLESMSRRGFLCLGAKESLKHSSHETEYEEFDAHEKIYRRMA